MGLRARAAVGLLAFLARPVLAHVHWYVVATAVAMLARILFALDGTLTIVVGISALVAWVIIVRRAARDVARIPHAYVAAFERGDVDEVAQLAPLISRLELFYDKRLAGISARARVAEQMIMLGRWGEVRDALAGMNIESLPAAVRAPLLNNLAYAMARMSDASAVAIARTAVAAAEEANLGEKAARSTLGTALVVAGRPEEALVHLEETATASESDRVRNDRMYWLGCAYRALGRKDDARAAFSVAAALEGYCTREAQVALDEETPFRS